LRDCVILRLSVLSRGFETYYLIVRFNFSYLKTLFDGRVFFLLYLRNQFGGAEIKAEIKPFEPESGNAGEGINWNVFYFFFITP